MLMAKYEAEIIGYLEKEQSKAGYIKELIKKDIKGELEEEVVSLDKDMAMETIRKYSEVTKKKYPKEYADDSVITITCTCGYSNNEDIIDKMESVDNKSEYMKNLILIDMGLIDPAGNRIVLPGTEKKKRKERSRKYNTEEERKAAKRETQKEYAKRTGYAAQKRYEENNKNVFKMQSVRFKQEEIEEIDIYCEENNIKRNTLIRRAVMKYIGKPI